MTPGISVIICCYNSEQRIVPTLEHLAAQDINDQAVPWEIILVNNCSTDNTSSVATDTWARLQKPNVPLHTINENRAGLSWARQKGLHAAKYDTVCFCDDDNWLQNDYLSIAFQIMRSNTEIGILGGQGIPRSTIAMPEWFQEYQGLYACGKLAEQSGDITANKWCWGAGMVLRTGILKDLYQAGFKHLNEDRKGNSLSSGGDTEICYWHVLAGKKLWYDERLVFTHFLPEERLSLNFAEQLNNELDLSYRNLSPYFPLIFSEPYENHPKPLLFFKALAALLLNRNTTALYAYLQPLFNFRLDKETRDILEHLKNFHANQKS